MKRDALSGDLVFEANTLSTVLVHPALAPAILSIYLIHDAGKHQPRYARYISLYIIVPFMHINAQGT